MVIDPKKDEEVTADEIVSAYEVELASLNEDEEEQVVEALREAEMSGELQVTDVDHVIAEAEAAENNRLETEEAQQLQAEAADRGDYQAAREHAETAQNEIQDAIGQGGQYSEAALEIDHDVQVLSEAEWQQEIADETVVDAVAYAEGGSESGTEAALDDAEDAQTAADDYGQSGNRDEHNTDPTIYSDG